MSKCAELLEEEAFLLKSHFIGTEKALDAAVLGSDDRLREAGASGRLGLCCVTKWTLSSVMSQLNATWLLLLERYQSLEAIAPI